MTPHEKELLDEVEELEEDPPVDDHGIAAARIVDWRFDGLSKLGLVGGEATAVACSDVDVHDVRRLMAAGCPLDLALRIAPDPWHRAPLGAKAPRVPNGLR